MRRKRIIFWKRILCILLLTTLLWEDFPLPAFAETTQQAIDRTEEEKEELEDQLDDTQDTLDDLENKQSSLQTQLSSLNQQLTEISENLEELEQEIADKEQEIADTQEALAQAQLTAEEQYESMKVRIRYMYENDSFSMLEALLSGAGLSDLLNLADYFEQIAAYDRQMLEEYQETCAYIASEEERLTEEKEELDAMKVEVEASKAQVAALISQTSNSIKEYESQIAEAEAQAYAYEAQIQEKEEDLEYLKAKLAEEIAMSQKAAGASWRDISEISFADGDRKLLANLIYCEAGGESYEGQLAVGAVVINRVRSSVYPNTVVGVIYQTSQFSPVASGRLELALAYDLATDSCYQAADAAMSGYTNVGNCVYFRTPVAGLTGITIGGHIFY